MDIKINCHENSLTVRGLIAHLLTMPMDAQVRLFEGDKNWSSNVQASEIICVGRRSVSGGEVLIIV